MPKGRLRTKQDVEDFVRGCTFFGTGGGGIPSSGVKTLLAELEAKKEIGWVDPQDISDDAFVASAFLTGSILPLSEREREELTGFGLGKAVHAERDMLSMAFKALENIMNRKVTALVPPEIGAANAPGPLALGALLRMPVVDGDYAGRSVPEVRNTSFCAHGKALWPLSCVDRFGNVTVIKRAASLGILEKLAKQLATAAYGLAGQASFVLTGKEMKEVVIPGTLTLSFSLGRFIRESRKRRQDVPRLTAEYLEGWLLLEGTIARKTEKKSGSCHTGTITVTNGKHKLDIWYKGESHLAKLGGRLVAMSPDLICVVRAGTGEPTIHAQLNAGDDVAVIGVRAHKLLRSKAGIEALGPRHWGFDIDYVPIEELVKRKRTSAL